MTEIRFPSLFRKKRNPEDEVVSSVLNNVTLINSEVVLQPPPISIVTPTQLIAELAEQYTPEDGPQIERTVAAVIEAGMSLREVGSRSQTVYENVSKYSNVIPFRQDLSKPVSEIRVDEKEGTIAAYQYRKPMKAVIFRPEMLDLNSPKDEPPVVEVDTNELVVSSKELVFESDQEVSSVPNDNVFEMSYFKEQKRKKLEQAT